MEGKEWEGEEGGGRDKKEGNGHLSPWLPSYMVQLWAAALPTQYLWLDQGSFSDFHVMTSFFPSQTFSRSIAFFYFNFEV